MSNRPYGQLFTKYEIRVEALPLTDSDVERIATQLHELDVVGLLTAVAKTIEGAIPDVRVEVRR